MATTSPSAQDAAGQGAEQSPDKVETGFLIEARNWLECRVEDPCAALRGTAYALGLLAVFYVSVQFVRTHFLQQYFETNLPWECSEDELKDADDDLNMCGPLVLVDYSMLNMRTDEEDLRNYLSLEQIALLKDYIARQRERLSPVLLAERRIVILAAAEFARLRASSFSLAAPDSLRTHRTTGGKLVYPDDDIRQLNLDKFLKRFIRLEAHIKLDEKSKEFDARRIEYDQHRLALKDLLEAEKAAFVRLKNQAPFLRPPLAFSWLYYEDAGWVFELIIWTLFGVLTGTLVAVRDGMMAGTYESKRFASGLSKLFYAPVMSLVVVAAWAAGITESGITFANGPFFLAFSFALGFGSDRVVRIVRRGVKMLLGGAEFSSEAIQKRGEEARKYRLKYSAFPRHTAAPKTISELRTRALERSATLTEETVMVSRARR